MATKTYGTSVIPSDQVTVLSGGTVDISLGFSAVIGIIGGMDTSSGTSTPGDVENPQSVSEAQDLFGDGSELHRAVKLAYQNGVADVFAVGVTETTVTGESAGGTSGTLSNTPVFDPNVNTEHSISATDSAGTNPTTNIVYDESPSTPSSGDEVNVNPVNGKFEFDAAADGSYTLDYDYGDYASAVDSILDEDIRFLCMLTESESVVSDAITDVNTKANDFNFMRVVGGIMPEITPGTHSDSVDDQRGVLVASPRGYTDSDATTEVRTTAAVAGKLTGSDLGESATGPDRGQLEGLESLRKDYTNTELGDFISEQVLPIKDGSTIHVVKDMTTSTDAKFERVYATEIVDEVAFDSHTVSGNFVGALNFDENRNALRDQHLTLLEDMATDRPPLLNDSDGGPAYSVNVSSGATDTEVDVEIGVDVVDVMDTINVTVTVGDVVKSAGFE